MNIILGASGQIGSAIIEKMVASNTPVKGIVRNKNKAKDVMAKGATVGIADSFDLPALTEVFKDGTTVFVITPETESSEDVLGDTKAILSNYKAAIAASPNITKIVGLSSIGAQYEAGTGNLLMSYMLEHAFSDLPIQQIFIRPAYYYSNFLPYLPMVKEKGILPSYFPAELKLPMSSPLDIAAFAADVINETITGNAIYEVEGPKYYDANNVAKILGDLLHLKINVQQIAEQDWKKNLKNIGFTEDAANNFIDMTKAVINGKAKPENDGVIKVKTSLEDYFKSQINGN